MFQCLIIVLGPGIGYDILSTIFGFKHGEKLMNRNDVLPRRLHFPSPFKHHHPPVQNINRLYEEQLTAGQRAADWVAYTMGSWKFIIFQSILLISWVLLNGVAWVQHWDPYPFILMNLVL